MVWNRRDRAGCCRLCTSLGLNGASLPERCPTRPRRIPWGIMFAPLHPTSANHD